MLAEVLQLREACRDKGFKVSGNKATLLARLRETSEARDPRKGTCSVVKFRRIILQQGSLPCPTACGRAARAKAQSQCSTGPSNPCNHICQLFV